MAAFKRTSRRFAGPTAQLECPKCGSLGVRGWLTAPIGFVSFYEDSLYSKVRGRLRRLFGTSLQPVCSRASWSAVTCKSCRLVWFTYPREEAGAGTASP